ncbi:MAG: DUF2971 domain-containing protein [Phycisphaerae bacterium]|nr:DUF2971 domain-containing protein [Phycisphaerae bacterium]
MDMPVLYKYCDQLGIVKILGSLELKLPYISEVNDPLECLPVFRCSNNEKEELYKTVQKVWRQQAFLLSFSEIAQNTVMWAHYSEKHKGAIIGIDFKILTKIIPGGIQMRPVDYPKDQKRPEIDTVLSEKWLDTLQVKSNDWGYEKEWRAIFSPIRLEELQAKNLAFLRDFNGRPTWFLRLSPESIREVVFGLYTEESLKVAIRKLIEQPELQHIKLYQTKESDTYTLNLIEIKR